MSSTSTPTAPSHRPYRGSCRCGFIRYVTYIPLPPFLEGGDDPTTKSHFYKCNCTACHKFGILHMRLPKAADDFYLLSPLDPEKELSDYKCARNTTSWYSCPTCGAKCFLIWGKGSVQDVELPENLLKPAKSGDELEKHDFSSKPLDEGSQKLVKTKAWKIDGRNWDEINGGCYFSINAHTLDPEDGFDLRELVENKWIKYLDCLQYKESKPSFSRPFPGGTY